MKLLQTIQEEIRTCALCPFNPTHDARYCGGYGTDFRAVFIAESPSTAGGTGIKDASANFGTTHADRLFHRVRAKFGLENCYVTDLVKCGVAAGKPDSAKIQKCLPYLRREIEAVQPRAIVAVGKSLALDVDGQKKSVPFGPFLEEALALDIPVFVTWHYSYVWNRCQQPIPLRVNPSTPGAGPVEIKPEKWLAYELQHEAIQKHLEQR